MPLFKRRIKPAKAEDRAKVACWCGARPGLACLNRDGSPAPGQHATRGMSKAVVNAMARSAGLPPLD